MDEVAIGNILNHLDTAHDYLMDTATSTPDAQVAADEIMTAMVYLADETAHQYRVDGYEWLYDQSQPEENAMNPGPSDRIITATQRARALLHTLEGPEQDLHNLDTFLRIIQEEAVEYNRGRTAGRLERWQQGGTP